MAAVAGHFSSWTQQPPLRRPLRSLPFFFFVACCMVIGAAQNANGETCGDGDGSAFSTPSSICYDFCDAADWLYNSEVSSDGRTCNCENDEGVVQVSCEFPTTATTTKTTTAKTSTASIEGIHDATLSDGTCPFELTNSDQCDQRCYSTSNGYTSDGTTHVCTCNEYSDMSCSYEVKASTSSPSSSQPTLNNGSCPFALTQDAQCKERCGPSYGFNSDTFNAQQVWHCTCYDNTALSCDTYSQPSASGSEATAARAAPFPAKRLTRTKWRTRAATALPSAWQLPLSLWQKSPPCWRALESRKRTQTVTRAGCCSVSSGQWIRHPAVAFSAALSRSLG